MLQPCLCCHWELYRSHHTPRWRNGVVWSAWPQRGSETQNCDSHQQKNTHQQSTIRHWLSWSFKLNNYLLKLSLIGVWREWARYKTRCRRGRGFGREERAWFCFVRDNSHIWVQIHVRSFTQHYLLWSKHPTLPVGVYNRNAHSTFTPAATIVAI